MFSGRHRHGADHRVDGSAAFALGYFTTCTTPLFHQEGLMKADRKVDFHCTLLLVAGYPAIPHHEPVLSSFGVLARPYRSWKSKQLGQTKSLNMGGGLLLMAPASYCSACPAILYLDYPLLPP